ncbi:MerR family transcriptional regulator [Brachybacterium alimentarium]|uniref:MerR family transcriptional regulator n=1 Tax=Brachybacterium alimentarium TaxID=47845 RepID=UPI003FD409D1
MHIGAIAERTGLSQRTLRHYDDIGLVNPSQRSEGGFRLYTEEDLHRLLLIRRMKPLAFSLQEMHDLLALTSTVASPDATEDDLAKLRAFEAVAAQRRADLTEKAAMADEFLDRLRTLTAHVSSGEDLRDDG